MKNLKKLSREELKSVNGGYMVCGCLEACDGSRCAPSVAITCGCPAIVQA
jgi:hypothetical protein